jgi:hypothetical protein
MTYYPAKILYAILLLLGISMGSSAQNINYTIPEGFEQKLSAADYKTIVDQSAVAVSQKFKVDSVKNGVIYVENQEMLALFGVLNNCIAQTDHSKWEAIINDHFTMLFNSMDQKKQLDLHNFDKIKPYLSIRIYQDAVVAARGGADNLITRTDIKGTITLLMLDLPQAFTNVAKKDFDTWNVSSDEAFKIAFANIAQNKVEKMNKVFDIDGAPIEFNFLGDDNYAASYAINLQTNAPELVGEWGSAIAIPNKGLVAICKISKNKPVDFVKFIQRIQPFIQKSYAESQGPISPGFFWYYKGVFTPIPVTTSDTGNINVTAPAGLSALMTLGK